jgi:CheY-like chemotaxis protein
VTTTLLAVDDSHTMRKVLEITFSGGDFRAILAQNAEDALAKLQAERPSVALVDAGLEGVSGYDLCQKIKSAAPGVAVILLSSKQQPFDRARGAQVGADDFMDKPFDTQQMIDKVLAVVKKGASSPLAAQAPVAAPAPMVAQAPVAAPAPGPQRAGERPRVQTLAYGSAPIPNIPPAAPAPVQAAPKPMMSAVPRPAAQPAPAAPAQVTPRPAEAAPVPRAVASAVAAQVPANGTNAEFAQKLGGLGLSQAQIEGVLSLSREVVERVVWEVVPTLAETLIKEEIKRLTSE